jgi:hypothetical protein
MNIFTHALIPVIVARATSKGSGWTGPWKFVAIGIAGGLPDILSPHLSLDARMTSWSHGIPCWSLFTAAMVLIAILSRKRMSVGLALILSGAYLLHLLCDAVSGGVDFLYPLGNWTWGAYWVDPIWWIPLDVVCLLACYWMFRIAPALSARKHAKQAVGPSRSLPHSSNSTSSDLSAEDS